MNTGSIQTLSDTQQLPSSSMIKAKILIVEDEVVTAMDIENDLQKLGYEVTAISNSGEDAIKRAEEDKPDIVLMDIQIHGEMDGIEAANILRSRFGIPVVYSTAHLDEEKFKRAHLTLPFGYILKPIQEWDLKVTIDMALFVAKTDTERRKAEELLQQSERKLAQSNRMLQTVLDTIPVRIFWKDKNLNFLGCNQLYAKDSGLKNPEELIGKDDYAMGWKNEADQYRADDKHVLETREKKLNYEEPHTTSEGEKMWLRTNKIPLEDENGEIFGILGTYEDITEQKQTEKALQESEEHYRDLFNNAQVGIYRARISDGMLIEINTEAAKHMGLPVSDILGKIHTIDLYQNAKHREKLLLELSQHGKVEGYELDATMANGRDVSLSISVHAYPEKDYMEGVVVDITKRKRAEKALVEREKWFSTTLKSIGDALITTDTDGNVTLMNPIAEALTGWIQQDAVGKPLKEIFKIINEVTREPVENPVEKVIKENRIIGLANHTILIAKDGREIPIDDSGSPIRNQDGLTSGVVLVFRDITERKQVQNALRESEEKYRNLVDNSPDLIYRTDATGCITFISESVKRLSGYTKEEAIGMNMTAEVYLNPNERDLLLAEISTKGFIQNFETELKRKDGSIWWASTNAHLTRDINGNVIGAEGATRDITEIKQTENALRESEEKFKLLATQSLMGVILFQDGLYQYVNDKVAEIFEYSVDELMSWEKEAWSKLVHPDDVDFVLGQARKKQAGDKDVVNHYSYRGISKSGRIKWIELYSASVTYRGKTASLVSLIDRTDGKEAEDALKDSEEKYRTVVSNAEEGIFVMQDGRFKYFNPEAVRLSGYSEEELLQMPSDHMIYPEDQELVKARRRQRKSGDLLPWRHPHRIVTKDGSIRWIEVKYVNITWNNNPAILSFVTDITEKKQSQELMIQTEKMMSVGGLAAGMAHELNNPLGGMLLGVQNIQRRLSPEIKSNLEPAKEFGINLQDLQLYLESRGVIEFLDGIKDSGRKASKIISNMLQFSRKSESKMDPIDLVKLMENTLELASKDYDLKKKYDFRSIEIIKEFQADLPLVPCTETEIEQVILNLLGNATYAMANQNQKGPHKITIRLSKGFQEVRIEIEDNGPGMDEKVKKRIFEPFYTTKPVGEGTGLGLSVSYMIITNNHKGTMEVASEPGHGTTFTIQLPLAEKGPQF